DEVALLLEDLLSSGFAQQPVVDGDARIQPRRLLVPRHEQEGQFSHSNIATTPMARSDVGM
ncbi:hypothetical protein CAI21_22265, partial [Alkalilimnicola ehrlichii]